MYRRADSKETTTPVVLRYRSLDGEQDVRTATLRAGSCAPEQAPVPTYIEPNISPVSHGPSAEVKPKPASHDADAPSAAETDNKPEPREDTVEATVCGVDDLRDGQMQEVDVGDEKVLLVKYKGEFHALGAKCSHYDAPLVKGVLCNGHVRCPWHGACFNIRTGDIEDFPGLDSVPKFDVEIDSGKVKISAKQSQLKLHKRTKPMARQSSSDVRPVTVIVGGGPSGLACAETLRQENYRGQIVMLTKDRHLPYDRPKLSKMMHIKEEQALLRDQQFYKDFDIEVKLETEVISLDENNNAVNLKDGSTFTFDYLLLATGTVARQLLSTPGHDLQNICTLRTLDDASHIAERASGKNVVIIGTSFIGVETAAYLADKAQSVTIVDLVEAPFQLALGREVGSGVKQLLTEKGVQFYFKNSAKEFLGEDGVVTGVVLQDDTRLEAELCIVGIGVVPATDFLKGATLSLTDRGFVNVDKQMRTNHSKIFAAGDITQFPLFMAGDNSVNIQHWQMAHQQGRIAALNMLNKDIDIKSVPFFWTQLFGKSIRYTGYGFGYDNIIMHGNPEELKFIAYYTKEERVIAVASMAEDPIAAQAAEAFLSGLVLTEDSIRHDSRQWTANI